MASRSDAAAVDRLLAERGDQLFRAAVALAGSRADGEDLLQAALERLLRDRRPAVGDLEGYLRRVLYNLAADGWRRRAIAERRLRLVRGSVAAGTIGAETFLPLRWTTTTNIPKLESYRTQQDLRWLPATNANLSHLRLTIPKGYHFT